MCGGVGGGEGDGDEPGGGDEPSRVRTRSLPFQNESSLSSIAIEPCPCGLAAATLRYIGSIPNSVSATMIRVAMEETAPAAAATMPGM